MKIEKALVFYGGFLVILLYNIVIPFMKKKVSDSSLNKEIVLEQLKTVLDPELLVDIVSLGLIYEVEIKENSRIKILMTLTSPGCPLAPVIDQMVRDALFGLVDDIDTDVVINLTFDPPWVPDMMSEEVRLELGL